MFNDERSFYDQFAQLISQAQNSIWLWSAWVASRVGTLLPLLQAAVDRGVRARYSFATRATHSSRRSISPKPSPALRAVVPNVIEVNVTHEKVVVIDDHTVMMGSLNALPSTVAER